MRAPLWISKQLLLGQLVSFAVSGTGVFTTLLVNHNRSFPLLQSLTAYAWIVVLFMPTYFVMLYKVRGEAPHFGNFRNFVPLQKLWRYALIAVVDLEANYVVVKAYQYTDMTSVQLLDCSTIPFVMALSYIFLKVRYTKAHAIGALIAIAGLALLIGIDADGLSRTSSAPNPVLGDLFCIISSACYAISNVACEKLIKVEVLPSATNQAEFRETHVEIQEDAALPGEAPSATPTDRTRLSPPHFAPSEHGSCSAAANTKHRQDFATLTDNEVHREETLSSHFMPAVPPWLPVLEYLAFMPACGLVLAAIQFACIEWSEVRSSIQDSWPESAVAYQLLFGAAMVFVYSGMPVLFSYSSATFANLSLLTADVYSVVWNVTVFGINPRWEFFVAYSLIVIGIVVFDTKGFEFIRHHVYLSVAPPPQ